ncbi:MAG: hypothetical protein U1E65_29185 [Myxococcota bacterium]
MSTLARQLLIPALKTDWARRATQMGIALGATLLVAQTVKEVANAVTAVRNAVDAMRKNGDD